MLPEIRARLAAEPISGYGAFLLSGICHWTSNRLYNNAMDPEIVATNTYLPLVGRSDDALGGVGVGGKRITPTRLIRPMAG